MKKNKLAKLEVLYKKIPKVECKGLCHQSCTLIDASKIEIKRAKDRLHFNPFKVNEKVQVLLKTGNVPQCGALKDKRCSIYHIRPAICRLYAAAEGLECPFGCKPEGDMISKKDAFELIREIENI